MALYQGCSPAEVLHPSQGETSSSALRASQKHHLAIWYFASWNVRTLLDVEGSIDKQVMESESDLPDEQKIDQVVDGLKHYRINVTGLQETKWFSVVLF